jgi:hypothetical protein
MNRGLHDALGCSFPEQKAEDGGADIFLGEWGCMATACLLWGMLLGLEEASDFSWFHLM